MHPQPSSAAAESAQTTIYSRVYQVLVLGMTTSTVLFAVGLVRALIAGEPIPLTQQWIAEQYSWDVYVHGLLHAQPAAMLMTATVILIATPVLRVAVSVQAFIADGNRRFAAVTGTVLGIIALTIVLALTGTVAPEGTAHAPAASPVARDAKPATSLPANAAATQTSP